MDFRSLTVKDCFANDKCVAIIKQYAPQIMKYPIKLFNKKSGFLVEQLDGVFHDLGGVLLDDGHALVVGKAILNGQASEIHDPSPFHYNHSAGSILPLTAV